MRGTIIYSERDGEAAEYARLLGRQFNFPAINSGTSSLRKVTASQALLIVSSLTGGILSIQKWMNRNLVLLKGKKLFLFVVTKNLAEKPERLNRLVSEDIPSEIRQACEVFYLPGDIADKELGLTHNLAAEIAARLYVSS